MGGVRGGGREDRRMGRGGLGKGGGGDRGLVKGVRWWGRKEGRGGVVGEERGKRVLREERGRRWDGFGEWGSTEREGWGRMKEKDEGEGSREERW